MAVEENYTDDAIITGTSKADEIFNGGSNVSINSGKGNDTIENWGRNVLFKYTGGNDSIHGFNETSTLQIASGKVDSLLKTDGDNYFLTVGKDTITLEGATWLNKVNIVDASGKAIKFKVNVVGTDDDDDIDNRDSKVTIDAGKGNDSITNWEEGSKVSISGGAGNDFIDNRDSKVTIDAGKGNDSIENLGDKVTIDGGTGNDTIRNLGDKVLFKYTGGNDLIDGFDSTSTLQIASGKMNSVVRTNGSDYFLTVGENTITLTEGYSLNKINIVDANGKAIKFTVDSKIIGTNGDDYLTNYFKKVTITSGEGDDTVYNGDWDNVGVNSVSMSSGAGNDDISNHGSKVTIDAGLGDDTISNSGKNVLFKYTGGNDIIGGFNKTSTLQIASNTLDSVIISTDEDYFLTVGKETVILRGAALLDKVNIVNSKGKAIKFKVKNITKTNTKDKITFNGSTSRD